MVCGFVSSFTKPLLVTENDGPRLLSNIHTLVLDRDCVMGNWQIFLKNSIFFGVLILLVTCISPSQEPPSV